MERKIFISHSHKDQDYTNVFVDLLTDFGIHETDIFYSSRVNMGVSYGEEIFEKLKTELQKNPIMVYFLSDNYYESVVCLNEMGASWVMADNHFPIGLPNFEPNKIVGAIGSSRLALFINKNLDEMDLFEFIEELCKVCKVEWPTDVRKEPIKYIRRAMEKFKKVEQAQSYLKPTVEGTFEAIIVKERAVIGNHKGKATCYLLDHLIAPEHLELEELREEESHYLYVWNNQGVFKKDDRVRFKLKNNEQKADQKVFSDIGNCTNIYVSEIEKVNE